ncbi:Undecaprenyl-phosphate alpha-N-acetylglucosaminyl 1-phosphate transferase [invertebrate metagenome]|uniref:Undecaprenyl-phosphate alpha-N-acetylglucosaminyl 1-phosphate transferase n=1 Tax=invertebrate metagenome TaxID=1711999 RepID=A0A2H9T3Y3_9ZZZZ
MQALLKENLSFRFLIVFLISVVLIKCWKQIAYRLHWVDKPDERKTHIGLVPLVGGVCIYTAIVVTVLILGRKSIELYSYLAAAGALVVVGALDDKYDISARLRLLIEFMASLIMIYGAGVYVNNLGNLFGQGDILLPMIVAVPFTAIAVAGYINALNMADGIDGMAASLGILTVLCLLILLHGNYRLFIVPSIALCAALLAFLVYNLQLVRGLRKVFLGDAGSMFLGFTFAWLVIRFSQGDDRIAAQFSPVTALFVLGLPLVDMLSTIIRRLKKKQNPLKPDRTHIHHILLHSGFSPRQALAIILTVGAVFHLVGITLHYTQTPDGIQLLAFIFISIIYYQTVINAFRFSQLIQSFRSVRRRTNHEKPFAQYAHSKDKLAEHGMADHLTHQPKEKHTYKNQAI